jgi:RNA polymerase sigma-70 factor (ECF subfamily)
MKPKPGNQVDAARLIREHQAGVWRYLRVLGCSPELAEDLTQETFLAVLQKPFVDHGPAATAAYLRQVAKNLYISVQRKAGRYTLVDDIDEIDETWERWAGKDDGETLLAALQECLDGLTDRARVALDLRFRERKSRQEIADAVEMTEDGAKNLLQRSKRYLRECIERKLGIEPTSREAPLESSSDSSVDII